MDEDTLIALSEATHYPPQFFFAKGRNFTCKPELPEKKAGSDKASNPN